MFTDIISQHILSILIFFPILGACAFFCIPQTKVSPRFLKNTAFAFVFLEFIFSLHLVFYFMPQSFDFQFASVARWLPLPGMNYTVGIDGLSVYFILLTSILSLVVFLSVYSAVHTNVRAFLGCFLMLEGTLIGALASLDLFLFYFFWEASLIPLYFMIGIWGGKDRIYATLKFFIYGVSGSLLMLVAFIYLYCATGHLLPHYSSNFLNIYRVASLLPFSTQCFLFAACTLAFAIKVPLFPFYTWLADTYEQSPALYTMMSGVVLKLAVYGLIRLSLCLFPAVAERYGNILLILALINILYGALIAWQQVNLRRIMAFSSLSHMGFIVLGIFAFNTFGLFGALYQTINHSITAAAFFILFQFIESKYKTLNINELGGLASSLPWFAMFFGIVAMSAVGLPSTGSFLGEWLILFGTFQHSAIFGAIAVLGVIFGAIYVLWFTYKVMYGPQKETQTTSVGLSKLAVIQLSILCVSIFAFGFASKPIFILSEQTLLHIQESVNNKIVYQAELVQNPKKQTSVNSVSPELPGVK